MTTKIKTYRCTSTSELFPGAGLPCPLDTAAHCCQHCRDWWQCDAKCAQAWLGYCEKKEVV